MPQATDTPTTATGAAAKAPVVVAFPPRARDVAKIAFDVEQLPAWALVPMARNMLALTANRPEPACATANLHAVFCAMLALCRVLDAADYPWDCVDRRRARA